MNTDNLKEQLRAIIDRYDISIAFADVKEDSWLDKIKDLTVNEILALIAERERLAVKNIIPEKKLVNFMDFADKNGNIIDPESHVSLQRAIYTNEGRSELIDELTNSQTKENL